MNSMPAPSGVSEISFASDDPGKIRAEAKLEFRRRLLGRTIAHAVRESVFYRDYYQSRLADRVQSPSDLPELPVLHKATILENYTRLITSSELPALVQHT